MQVLRGMIKKPLCEEGRPAAKGVDPGMDEEERALSMVAWRVQEEIHEPLGQGFPDDHGHLDDIGASRRIHFIDQGHAADPAPVLEIPVIGRVAQRLEHHLLVISRQNDPTVKAVLRGQRELQAAQLFGTSIHQVTGEDQASHHAVRRFFVVELLQQGLQKIRMPMHIADSKNMAIDLPAGRQCIPRCGDRFVTHGASHSLRMFFAYFNLKFHAECLIVRLYFEMAIEGWPWRPRPQSHLSTSFRS